MNTVAINIKTQPETKARAQKIAKTFGMSLSSLVDVWLKQFVKTRRVNFDTREEIPSKYLIDSLKKSEEDIKAGRVSPGFDNASDAVKWLNK
jgi:addiction module RelB/DinJ family antitoxin